METQRINIYSSEELNINLRGEKYNPNFKEFFEDTGRLRSVIKSKIF